MGWRYSISRCRATPDKWWRVRAVICFALVAGERANLCLVNVQVIWGKTPTTANSTVLAAYPLNVAQFNVPFRVRLRVIEHGLALVGFFFL